jgi:hypothetical protein
MLKKHMTPIGIHRAGSLHTSPNKGSSQRNLVGAGAGGAPSSIQDYAKATPMADSDQPAPVPDGLGSGTWGGIATG